MKYTITSKITKAVSLLLIIGVLFQIPDIIGSPEYIYQRLNITSNTIIFLTLSLAGIWRIVSKTQLFSLRLNLFLLISATIIFLLSMCMTILDKVYYLNYIYSITKVNYDQLGFLSFSLFSIWILNQSNTFFSKHKKQLIMLFPFFIFLIFYMMYHWPYDVLKRSLSEDGQVEYIQVLFLLISCILSIAISRYLKIKKCIFLSILYGILAIGLFFIAGEEVSWGQRILNIATPESLKVINRQEEITIHNINGVESIVGQIYIYASIYAAFGFILIPGLSKIINSELLDFLIPRKYYVFYFLPIIVYHTSPLRGIIPYIPEVVELFFYAGIMVFLLENYYFSLERSTKVGKKM